MPETFPRGRFVWHELMTTDPDAAVRFYTQVIGWKSQRWEHDPSYRLWTMGTTLKGGLMRLSEGARRRGAPPSWVMHVAVPDVDATVRQATALGARTSVPPTTIPVGRFAVLADPQGATVAVYKPGAGQGMGSDDAELGDFSWHELATTSPAAAWDFYHALFGWDKSDAMDMGAAGVYQMYGRAGRMLGGIYAKPREMAAPSHWLCYVKVPSVDTTAAVVTRLGGRVTRGPMDVPGGSRIVMCVDPQGAMFALHSFPPAPARAKAAPTTKPKPKPKAKPKKPRRARATAKARPTKRRRPVRKRRR